MRGAHLVARLSSVALVLLGATAGAAQSIHEAPAGAPSSGRVAPAGEPGRPLHVSGVVVREDGTPVPGASLYIYQTDHEGYYGVKPVSDNRNPRLTLFLRSGSKGEFAFDTVVPGEYPGGRIPAHIHFEVGAQGYAPKIFEIVFEGFPFVTDRMRTDPAFSVRPIDGGRATERIVLTPSGTRAQTGR